MIEIEKAFNNITKLIIGTELKDIDSYGEWLGRRVPLPYLGKSALSGKDVWVPPSLNYLKTAFNPSKIISMEEMEKASSSPFGPEDIESADMQEIMAKFIKPVAFFCGNFRYLEYENFEKVSGGGGGRNVYVGEDTYHEVKNIAFSNYTLFCESMFGCYATTHSQFCIHAYRSVSVSRCFEVDCCSSSRDLLFCHNCENLQDSMFCFNAKNMKHAIGNMPLPQDKYKEIKFKIIGEIANELKDKKGMKFDIFNIGSA